MEIICPNVGFFFWSVINICHWPDTSQWHDTLCASKFTEMLPHRKELIFVYIDQYMNHSWQFWQVICYGSCCVCCYFSTQKCLSFDGPTLVNGYVVCVFFLVTLEINFHSDCTQILNVAVHLFYPHTLWYTPKVYHPFLHIHYINL